MSLENIHKMRQDFEECYTTLFKDTNKIFKNLDQVKKNSIKTCGIKAFNSKFMTTILNKQKTYIEKEKDKMTTMFSTDQQKSHEVKEKYNLDLVSLE